MIRGKYKKGKFKIVFSCMKSNKYDCSRFLFSIFFIILLTSQILIGSTLLFQEASAGRKEFEVEEFEEKIIIPVNKFQAIDFNFNEGKQLEIIFTLQEKEERPIDIWFVNEDNHLLLSGGAQFLYFIDGTEKQVSYAKKVVSLIEHDVYKLVVTNYYANKTVEVNIAGEIRTYGINSAESSSEDTSIWFNSLIIIVVILAVLLIVLFVKNYGSTHIKVKTSNKIDSKKNKSKKSKSKKNKSKESNKVASKKSTSKSTQVSEDFCGYCGKSVFTPYCKNCGHEI